MNLLRGAAPTAAPSFFAHNTPPSGFIYAVAPATALIVIALDIPAIQVRPCHRSAVASLLSHSGPSRNAGASLWALYEVRLPPLRLYVSLFMITFVEK